MPHVAPRLSLKSVEAVWKEAADHQERLPFDRETPYGARPHSDDPTKMEHGNRFNRDGSRSYSGIAVLPTGAKLNPTTNEGTYASPNQTHLVVDVKNAQGGAAHRVISTYGDDDSYQVGDTMHLSHDQTGHSLSGNSGWRGSEVVGIARPDGTKEGFVPNKNVS